VYDEIERRQTNTPWTPSLLPIPTVLKHAKRTLGGANNFECMPEKKEHTNDTHVVEGMMGAR